MTKSNNGPFTHHERLRYSYLLKILLTWWTAGLEIQLSSRKVGCL